MLRDVLRLAAARGAIRSEELTRALGTSPELVRLVLDDLVRRELLEAIGPGGSSPCQQCPVRAACLYRCQARVWTLTRKGAAWVAAIARARLA